MRINRYKYWSYAAVLYSCLLIGLSLYPRVAPPSTLVPKERSSGLLPQQGDNFKVVDDVVVYHLEHGKRRPYKTMASYLQRPGNPPFGTPYREGGILLVDSLAFLRYPLGAEMPRLKDTTSTLLLAPAVASRWWYTYTRWDKLGHGLVYFILGLLLWGAWWRPARNPKRLVLRTLLVGGSLGLALEWAQAVMNIGRDAEWADLVMNGVGLTIGIGLGYWYTQKKSNQQEGASGTQT